MKKILAILTFVFVLTACQVQSIQEIKFTQILESFEHQGSTIQNVITPKYSFYRPFHSGIKDSGPYFASMMSNQEIILFNVDVVGVIAKELYESSLNNTLRTITLEAPLVHYVGDYKNHRGITQAYELKLTKQGERYTIMLRSFDVVLTSNVALANIESVLKDMIIILRNSTVNDELIMSLYTNVEKRLDLQSQSENLFNQLAPESGTIADMISLLKGPPTLEELLREYQNLPEEPIIEGEEENEDGLE
ncbi:MAG: membrane lipoprotein lipid attachment site-containing protein [Erysipelothrix sp.]|nr:membrane lipoprotein lipid attachment site-containing protein [Erysipelothrix sp.]